MTGDNLFVCKVPQKDQMSDEKEVKLVVPKSLMVVLWVAAVGLVPNGVQPILSTPANAVGGVQKMAICDSGVFECKVQTGLPRSPAGLTTTHTVRTSSTSTTST